jgi:hypothetical protein
MVGCDDAPDVANLIEEVADHGQPFSSRHRIVDTRGRVHPVLVVGDLLTDADGTVHAAVADFTAHRAVIEQAKGILMVVYSISADRAFDILVWRSQETNTKLRTLARYLIDDFTSLLQTPAQLRERADHLLLTVHERDDATPSASSDVLHSDVG